MKPTLTAQIVRSLSAIERQLEMVCERHAADPSALARGTRREIARCILGLGEIRNALHSDAALELSGSVEMTADERRVSERLVTLLQSTETSWTQVSETLAAEGFRDHNGRAFRRERLILLALSHAGSRYAAGCPLHGEGERVFDLFNLPAEVGGRGGLPAIVRACFNHTTKYGMRWTFTDNTDDVDVVDDDADVTAC